MVVQKYAPPKTINTHKTHQHLFNIITTTISILKITPNKLILKTHKHQKNKNQYQKLNKKNKFLKITKYNTHL